MMNNIFGAFAGGTIRGAHHGVDSVVLCSIVPPNSGSGAGNCFPSIVVVADGDPMVPVVSTCAIRFGLETKTKTKKIDNSDLIFITFIISK
jgi:hypothetical protein